PDAQERSGKQHEQEPRRNVRHQQTPKRQFAGARHTEYFLGRFPVIGILRACFATRKSFGCCLHGSVSLYRTLASSSTALGNRMLFSRCTCVCMSASNSWSERYSSR